jgi:hypothetical protein
MASEEITATTAFAVAPATTEKTNLITDVSDLLTGIDDAATAGAFSADTRDVLKAQVLDVAEDIAANMTDHV